MLLRLCATVRLTHGSSAHGKTPECLPRSSALPHPPAATLPRPLFRWRPTRRNARPKIAPSSRQQSECPNQKSPAPGATSSTPQFHPEHSVPICHPSAPVTASPLSSACKCRRRSSPCRDPSAGSPTHRPCLQCSSHAAKQNAESSPATSLGNSHSRTDGRLHPRCAPLRLHTPDTSSAYESSCVRADGRHLL